MAKAAVVKYISIAGMDYCILSCYFTVYFTMLNFRFVQKDKISLIVPPLNELK